jgi:hypothetical protein
MKLDKVKKTKSKVPAGKNLFKKIMAVLLSLAVFGGSVYFIRNAMAATHDTVAVLRVKAKEGVPAEAVLTMENLEKYDIIRKEYTADMVLAENIEDALEKYTTNYLRSGAIIHTDEYGDAKPQKNEWLYVLGYDKEGLTIPFNYLESGGDILTPGDRVRIRVKYEVEEKEEVEDDDFSDMVYSPPLRQGKKEVTEILFESIEVADMLNSKGHSIYEVYREILRYQESERQRLLKSDEFMNSIIPKSLILAATKEEANQYLQYKSSSIAILITLLARDENTSILDMPTLKSEVEIWLEKQK